MHYCLTAVFIKWNHIRLLTDDMNSTPPVLGEGIYPHGVW